MKFEEFESNVVQWADNKGITKQENSPAQAMKIMEELGETCGAYLKQNREELKDGIGDVMVTLVIFAKQNNLTIEECIEAAWNEIKDRKGKLVNGSFIKEKI